MTVNKIIRETEANHLKMLRIPMEELMIRLLTRLEGTQSKEIHKIL